MDNHPDDQKQTSRPGEEEVRENVNQNHVEGDQTEAILREPFSDVRVLRLHTTPPPIVIGEGSLLVESWKQFTTSGGSGSSPKRFKIEEAGQDVQIHFIRLLKGNGETYDAQAAWHPSRAIHMTIETIDEIIGGGTSIIEVGEDVANGERLFYIEVQNGKNLEHKGNPSKGKKRGNYYRFHSRPNLKNHITRLWVSDTGVNPVRNYNINFSTLPEDGNEFQVMIWLEAVDRLRQ